jgi:hypothetical protein
MTQQKSPKITENNLSVEEAKRLGFKFPEAAAAPESEGAPQSTKIIGFFNANRWPINIQSSELGVTIFLRNHGEYLVSRDGKKVNDPRLEKYCGVYGLAKEEGKADLPINWIRPPATQAASLFGFEAGKVVRSSDGNTTAAPSAPPAHQPHQQITPVGAMSMAQARKLGLVESSKPLPEDDPTAPVDSTSLMDSKRAIPALRTPNFKQTEAAAKNAPTLQQLATVAQNVGIPVAESVLKADSAAVEKVLSSAQGAGNPDAEDVVGAALAAVRKGEEFTQIQYHNLPEPDLDDLPDDTTPVTDSPLTEGKSAIVDPFSGKTFRYRSQLLTHARRRKYTAEQINEIERQYPAPTN